MKKRSVIGIIITIILSVILFPLVWAGGLAGSSILAVSSVVKEERKEDIYNVFMENGGTKWIYGMVDEMIQESIEGITVEGLPNMDAIFEGIVTEEDVATIVDELYHDAVKGEIYQLEVAFIGDRVKKNASTYFDAEADNYIEENLVELYRMMDEETKAQIKAEAKAVFLEEVEKEFDAQADAVLEERVNEYIKKEYPNVPSAMLEEKKAEYMKENKDRILAEAKAEVLAEAETQFDAEADTLIEENIETLYAEMDEETKAELKEQVKVEFLNVVNTEVDTAVEQVEQEVNATIRSVYESPEYAEFMQMQETYGVNVYQLDRVNEMLVLAAYLCYGFAAVAIVLMLLSHLFRPSGFFVSGAVTLLLGGLVMAVGKQIPSILSEMLIAEVEMPHESLWNIVLEALNWFASGFTASAMTILFVGLALILLGVLFVVIRRNKAA